MFILLILAHLVFIYFFWIINFHIGIYIVGFFLSIFLVLSLISDEGKGSWKDFLKKFFLEYIAYINFILILIGIFFIINYFFINYFKELHLAKIASTLTIISISIFVFLISSLIGNEKIIKISFFSQTIFWIYLYFLVRDIKIFEYFIAISFSSSIVAHLLFLIGKKRINKTINYINFLLGTTIIFIIMGKYLLKDIIELSLGIQIFILLVLFMVIIINNRYQKIINIKEKYDNIKRDINLFGYSEIKVNNYEEKFYKKFKSKESTYKLINDFFINSPIWVKILFSITNTIPIVISSSSFIINHNLQIKSIILYWISSILYFINFILFKKLNWFIHIQRLFAFFVINFVVYFSIINIFGENYKLISITGIIWNIIISFVMIFIGKKGSILEAIDYLIWSIINLIGLLLNIYFILKSGLNFYLSIGIITLYIGVFLFIYRIIYKRYFL